MVDSGASGKFTVDARYAFIKKLGGGAYGLVAQFNDSVTGEVVAIKKTTKAFDDPVDAKRTLRELKLLNHLEHENIVRLVDVLPGSATSARTQQDVYVAMESMDTDLHQIIRSKQDLTDEHSQYNFQLNKAIKKKAKSTRRRKWKESRELAANAMDE